MIVGLYRAVNITPTEPHIEVSHLQAGRLSFEPSQTGESAIYDNIGTPRRRALDINPLTRVGESGSH